MPSFASRTEPSQTMALRPRMPPRVFSTLTSPMTLSEWALTFFRSSRLAGMTCLRVVLRSGSEEEEYWRALRAERAAKGLFELALSVLKLSEARYGLVNIPAELPELWCFA